MISAHLVPTQCKLCLTHEQTAQSCHHTHGYQAVVGCHCYMITISEKQI